MSTVNEKAVKWALSKIGYEYSQAKRTQENYFDCSSLVARAYQAAGDPFTCSGAPIPTSNKEVYDDNFELLWPEKYADIGKKMGGEDVIEMATKPGDLQFLKTSSSSRSNKITHVTMVVDEDTIVHARGTAYGVRTDKINLYKGKVCAVVRYNPKCELRRGHYGDRVRELQRQLNKKGANIEVDGNYGPATEEAVEKYMNNNYSSENNTTTTKDTQAKYGVCTGGTVNIRKSPSTSGTILCRVYKGDKLLYLSANSDWARVAFENNGQLLLGYMSKKYIDEVT